MHKGSIALFPAAFVLGNARVYICFTDSCSFLVKAPINETFNLRATLSIQYVVATTRRNGTHSMLTSAKLSNGLSSSGVYKRTQQGALAAFIYYLYT